MLMPGDQHQRRQLAAGVWLGKHRL